MPKHDFSVCDQERMTNYVSLAFAADVEPARQLCPRQGDHEFDLREIRKLVGDYVIVTLLGFRTPTWHDTSLALPTV